MFDKIKIVAGLMTIVSLSQCSIALAGEVRDALDRPSGVATQAAEGYYTNSANPSDSQSIKHAPLAVDLSVLHFESTLASAILSEKIVTNEVESDLSTKNNSSYLISRQPNKSVSVAQDKKNYLASLLSASQSLTLFGINSKVGIGDQISLRPFLQYGTKTTNFVDGNVVNAEQKINVIQYGASATYDFSNPKGDLTPYGGIGFIGTSTTFDNTNAGLRVTGNNSSSYLFIAFGADYNFGDSIVINADYKLFNNEGVFAFGGGYRF